LRENTGFVRFGLRAHDLGGTPLSSSRFASRADQLAHDLLLSASGAGLVAAAPEAVLRGTEGDDVITPTQPAGGPNTTEGNDTVTALGGNDLVDGGGGDDSLDGGAGNDTLLGDDGNDRLVTGDGFNVAVGGDGNDTIVGGNQSDAGTYYDDTTGNYYQGLDGGTGDDSIDAGAGDDRLYGGDGADTLRGGDGNDVLIGGYDDYADSLDGGAGNDEIFAYNGDRAFGRSGDDTLHGEGDGTLLNGGSGNDLLEMSYFTSSSRIVAGNGADTISAFSYDSDLSSGFSLEVDAGNGDDVITIQASRVLVNAGKGDDVIVLDPGYGLAPAGEITTGAGSDLIVIGSQVSFQTDAVIVTDFQAGPAGDRLDIDALVRQLVNYAGSNPFASGHLRLVADGRDTVIQLDQDGPGGDGAWVDAIRLNGVAIDTLTPDNFAGIVTPFIDTDPRNRVGTGGDDTLIGAEGNDSLQGLAGDDYLDGGFSGIDSLRGGDGTDLLFAGADGSSLSGDGGSDFLLGGAGNDTLLGGDGDDNLYYTGVLRGRYVSGTGLSGGDGDDSLDGGGGADFLLGGRGRDTVLGGDGNDDLRTDEGYGEDDGDADVARGGTGNDTVFGGVGDSLYGGVGDDELNANEASAVVDGGAGRDVINIRDTYLEDVVTAAKVDGGDGDDSISGAAAGAVSLNGGLGSDSIIWTRYQGASEGEVTILGDGGNDSIYASGDGFRITGGMGNDSISAFGPSGDVYQDTKLLVELGGGRDTVAPSVINYDYIPGHSTVTVQDFNTTGDSADRIDLRQINQQLGLAADADPFATGQVRLMRDGSNTVLEVQHADGFGGVVFAGVLVLNNVAPADLTSAHFVQSVLLKISTNVSLPDAGENLTIVVPEDAMQVPLNLGTPSDPDGGTVSIRIERTPEFYTIARADGSIVFEGDLLTPQEFAGLMYTAPYDNEGGSSGTLRYTVTDNEGSAVTRDVAIEISPIPDAPELSLYDQGYVATGGTEFRLDLDDRVYDPDSGGADLSFSITSAGGGSLPRWLKYDPVTHELYGTAPYGEDRDIELTVTVTDETGLSDQQNLVLRADAAYLSGSEADDVLRGTTLNDVLIGNGGNDRLDGRQGADAAEGGAGDDVYVIDDTRDVVYESGLQGSDEVRAGVSWTLSANTERLVLTGHAALNGTGNAEANTIIGNDAANRLSGADGADTLVGGAGNDTLTGGAQADWFRIEGTPAANGIDRIVDLESGFGRDVIDLAPFFGRAGGSVLDGDRSGGDAFDAFTAPAAIQGQHVIAIEDALGGSPSSGDIEALLRGFTFDNGSKQAFVVHDTTTGDGYLFYAQDRSGDGNASMQSSELTLVAELDFAKGRTFDGLDAANFRTSESAASGSGSGSSLAPAQAPAAPAADNLHAWFGGHETSLMRPLTAGTGAEMQRMHEMY
jgi:Ca2+-binding RTX toxin-like protein